MLSKSLRLTKIKNFKKVTFKITPVTQTQRAEKLRVSEIKKLPRPPSNILENPSFQEHARKEMKRTQKLIERKKKESDSINDFPGVKDIPSEDD